MNLAEIVQPVAQTTRFTTKVALKAGQACVVAADANKVELASTAGGRFDYIAILDADADTEAMLSLAPAVLPALIGNETGDTAPTAGKRIKVTAQGNFSAEADSDPAGTIYVGKAHMNANKGDQVAVSFFHYEDVKT